MNIDYTDVELVNELEKKANNEDKMGETSQQHQLV